MALQTLNNAESGAVIRGKINSNFTYLKSLIDDNTADIADLATDMLSKVEQTDIDASITAFLSSTVTLTNKRITPRIGTTASSATPTPTGDSSDVYTVTALAAAAAFAAPSGTPTNGQKLILRIKDNGTARALTWDSIYRAIGVTLPTTTVISKTLYVGMIYNSADTKRDVIAVGQQA